MQVRRAAKNMGVRICLFGNCERVMLGAVSIGGSVNLACVNATIDAKMMTVSGERCISV